MSHAEGLTMRTTWLGLTVSAVLVASLIVLSAPGAPAPEGPGPVNEKDVKASQNNLKQIGLAFHNYAAEHDSRLPGDILDKNGKALLSWRVVLLPYFEENKLYLQFKLDEPWDSDNNKKLVEKLPKIYAPIRVKAKAGETFYQTFTGKNTLFDTKPIFNIGNIPDGTSNTGFVFEAGQAVIWSKPADMPFDEKKPLPKIGGLFDGECNVLLGDGAVIRLKKDPDEKELRNLIMPADGIPINFDKLKK
jgi:hypothetical protein